jgi:hypothetical protein
LILADRPQPSGNLPDSICEPLLENGLWPVVVKTINLTAKEMKPRSASSAPSELAGYRVLLPGKAGPGIGRSKSAREPGPTARLKARDAPASRLDAWPTAVQIVAGMYIAGQEDADRSRLLDRLVRAIDHPCRGASSVARLGERDPERQPQGLDSRRHDSESSASRAGPA